MSIYNKIKNNCFFYKLTLLLIVLCVGFSIRIYYNNDLPVEKRHNYSVYYTQSFMYATNCKLSLLDNSSRKVVDDFLSSKINSLNIDDLKCVKNNSNIFKIIKNTRLGTFNYYIAGIVWKFFGVSWSNLFNFYTFISMLACFSLFLVGRAISRSYWGGLFSALAYIVSTPEIYGGVWSIRDASPVWFFSFSLMFLFVFTGIYKNKFLNYFSYYLLGIVTLLGIGWRSDALLFFPALLLMIIITLIIDYKKKKKSLIQNIYYVLFFVIGCYSVLLLDGKIRGLVTPFAFMHIALYAEDARSQLGQYENNFEINVSDMYTKIQVENYKSVVYPNQKITYMKGDYGRVSMELYFKVVKHNIYQWVNSFPQYFYKKFILIDVRLNNIRSALYSFTFDPTQNVVLMNLWSAIVIFSLFGGAVMFFLNWHRFEVTFFLGFVFYYSLIYWAIFPAAKHIIIMSVPISILSGLFAYFIVSYIVSGNIRNEINSAIINKKNIKFLIYTILFFVTVYGVMLALSSLYSKSVKQQYVDSINDLLHYENINKLDVNVRDSSFSIDLSSYQQVGLLVDFYMKAKNDYVMIQKNKGLPGGQLATTKYTYKISNDSNEHKLFTVCSKMGGINNVKIDFPKCAIVKNVQMISLNKWDGVQYTTVFNDKNNSSGAQSVRDSKKLASFKKNKDSILLARLDLKDFIINSQEKNSELMLNEDSKEVVWNVVSKRDYIWSGYQKKPPLNSNSYFNVVFDEANSILDQNLFVMLRFYDKRGRGVYSSPVKKIKDVTIYENNGYEIIFDVSNVDKSAVNYGIIFKTQLKGEYALPKKIKIFQTFLSCDKELGVTDSSRP